MKKQQHGDITVTNEAGFECWKVTATLYLDPKKMVLTEPEREKIQELLRNCVQDYVAASLKRIDENPVRKLTKKDILKYPLGI